ncbi:hypothetical protein LTR56_014931 [Elasticomyces elasticus]|nr:hypothetical protein LTR56_014931 [Elasticomyces elasticus]KAK4924491.1 hypothetical protein LTR49_008380 [Elasticomyces elasticus]KAK5761689.1 hypothetical protein LTS12_008121 [Elasticomyces elasticus]
MDTDSIIDYIANNYVGVHGVCNGIMANFHWCPKDPPPVGPPPVPPPPVAPLPPPSPDLGVIEISDDETEVVPQRLGLKRLTSPARGRSQAKKHQPQHVNLESAARQPLSPLSTNVPRLPKPAGMKAGRRRAERNKRFGSTWNLAYYSISLIQKIFPKLDTQAVIQDLYKRKESIVDGNGIRLSGTAPYDHDPEATQRHYAFTWRLQEMLAAKGHLKLVLLFGTPVRNSFVEKYGEFTNGDYKTIGGRQVRIFHLYHPEYIGRYAPRAQLRILRQTLLQLQRAAVELDLELDMDFDELDRMILSRGQPPNRDPCVRRATKPDVERGTAANAWIGAVVLTKNAATIRTAYYNDPTFGQQRREAMRRARFAWWDDPLLSPERRAAASRYNQQAYDDPVKGPQRRAKASETTKETFADPVSGMQRRQQSTLKDPLKQLSRITTSERSRQAQRDKVKPPSALELAAREASQAQRDKDISHALATSDVTSAPVPNTGTTHNALRQRMSRTRQKAIDEPTALNKMIAARARAELDEFDGMTVPATISPPPTNPSVSRVDTPARKEPPRNKETYSDNKHTQRERERVAKLPDKAAEWDRLRKTTNQAITRARQALQRKAEWGTWSAERQATETAKVEAEVRKKYEK